MSTENQPAIPPEFWPSPAEMARARQVAATCVEVVEALRRAHEQAEANEADDDEPPETGDELVPVSRIGRQFGRTPRTIRRWVKEGKFGPTVAINGRPYVRRRRVEAVKGGQADTEAV